MTILVRCDKYKHLKPPIVSTALCAKEVVQLLYSLFIVAPIVWWSFAFGRCFVISTLCPFSFCITRLVSSERVGCMTFIVFWIS